MDDRRDLERTLAFERRIVERVSTRLVPFPWGTAYLNDGFRERWDSNFLWVDARGGADASDLTTEADRLLGGAGLMHREIRVDDDVYGASLAPALAAAGYGGERLVVMALRREPDRSPVAEAEEIDLPSLRTAIETVLRREPWATSEEVVQRLADFRNELERRAGARFFCARADGEIVSLCELYLDGGVAQIEDVNTLEEFRDQGLGRAVVQAAIEAAVSEDAELVFIHALEDDWPKDLYAKLGFDAIGHVWSFVRPSAPLLKSQA
jgi:ribosomal protein S18 acetylase RimI-like enzyme